VVEIRTISTEELARELDQGGDFHFWNVLSDQFFHGELIPGSHRVPSDKLDSEVPQMNLPKNSSIVVYCGGPDCPQSRLATEKLTALGFTNVRAYLGGLEEWKQTGHETTRTKTAPA
jgi:rhodanese-related sulfurtransferase